MNSRTHISEIFESIVKAEGMKVYKKGKWAFQQDSISAHMSKCKPGAKPTFENLYYHQNINHLQPLVIPPPNYSIWVILKSRENAKNQTRIEALKATLLKE